MKVLVACEFSGRVRDAFLAHGHDALSCDLLPSERPGPHYQGNVLDILDDGWELMIAHPPCTYLASSGARWWAGRRYEQAEAIAFVRLLALAPIPHIAIENPIGILSTRWRKPDQIIQPWMFGHAERKATCLWLKELPPLAATLIMPNHTNNLTPSGQNKIGKQRNRWKIRSRTYAGIAEAMAQQWG